MGHLHDGILLTVKKKILPFETVWIDMENFMLSDMSQSEKDKYHMISLMWNNEQTELISKIETDSQIEKRMTAKRGEQQGMEGLRKKEKRLMDMDNSVVIGVGERGYKGTK